MMHDSVQPRDLSKTLCSKYSQKLLDHARQSATDAIKTTAKRVVQKIAEATGNKLAIKLLIESKNNKNFTGELFRNS